MGDSRRGRSGHDSIFPAVDVANEWVLKGRAWVEGERVCVPVLALRFAHDTINNKMMFGSGGREDDSIYKFVDQLIRGTKTKSDDDLEIIVKDGKIYSLSNRRLAAFLMYQSLRREEAVFVNCVVRNPSASKSRKSMTTKTDGLSIAPATRSRRSAQVSQHWGAPLFERGNYVQHELKRLQDKHPLDFQLSNLIDRLATTQPLHEDDGVSLDLCSISDGDRSPSWDRRRYSPSRDRDRYRDRSGRGGRDRSYDRGGRDRSLSSHRHRYSPEPRRRDRSPSSHRHRYSPKPRRRHWATGYRWKIFVVDWFSN